MDAQITEATLGLIMGLAYIAGPGPVNVETLSRGIRGGAWEAFSVQAGACTGHVCYALLAFAGVGVLMLYPTVHLLLGLVGAGLLLYLGSSAVRDGWRELRIASQGPMHSGTRKASTTEATTINPRTLGIGAAISLANPYAVAFWLSVGGTVLHGAHGNGDMFLVGFFLSVLLWVLALPLAIGFGRSLLQGRVFGWIAEGCGAMLIVFGLTLGHALVVA